MVETEIWRTNISMFTRNCAGTDGTVVCRYALNLCISSRSNGCQSVHHPHKSARGNGDRVSLELAQY